MVSLAISKARSSVTSALRRAKPKHVWYGRAPVVLHVDMCVPAFYPKALQELTLEIFAGGLRECEVYLASILFGKLSISVEYYKTSVWPSSFLLPVFFFFGTLQHVLIHTPFHLTNSYMWVQSGQRVTPDEFHDQFETTMSSYCMCKVKPRSYRQIAVGIAQEHIPPWVYIENNTINEAAHHRGHVTHGHYGIVEEIFPISPLTQSGGTGPSAESGTTSLESESAGHPGLSDSLLPVVTFIRAAALPTPTLPQLPPSHRQDAPKVDQ